MSTTRSVVKVLKLICLGTGLAVSGSWLAVAMMSTPGQFKVSETGAAVYEIPIKVPPGTVGIEPKLSLAYNSQADNGLLGVGWSLSGTSVITRCPRTVAQDGFRGGVNFDMNDRFCLDGHRLIAISGVYGANGTEYRTERESFAKVISFGTAGNGPAWFRVSTKGGQTLEYGNTTDSRIEAQGKATVRVWALNKASNTKGNYLTLTYAEDSANGDYRPTRIDYTGNTNAPNGSVQFLYASRPDAVPLYQGGSLIKNTVRMTNIKTFVGTSLVKDYRFSYEQSSATQRTRLLSVTECSDAINCLPATAFGYQNGGMGLSIPNYNTPALPSTIPGGFSPSSGPARMTLTGDFNGDGKTDYMWVPDNGDGRWLIAYSAGAGFTIPNYNTPALPSTISGGRSTRPRPSQGQWYMRVGDFNGDGRTDYMWVPDHSLSSKLPGDGRWLIAYATDTGFTIPDYNTPALPATIAGGFKTLYTASPFYMRIGDFNGDGRADYMWIPPGGDFRWLVAYSTGTGFTIPDYNTPALPATIPDGWFTRGSAEQDMLSGDFNGDGKTDYMWRPNKFVTPSDGRWLIAYSTGTGFTIPDYNAPALPGAIPGGWLTASSNGQPQLMRTGDFNRDGKTDYMWSPGNGDGRWLIAYSTGTGFTIPDYNTPALPSTIPGGFGTRYSGPNSPPYMLTADFNGDGKTDYMWVPDNGDGRWVIAYSTGTGFTIPDYNTPALPRTITGGFLSRAVIDFLVGDFNGDGKTDYMWAPADGDNRWLASYHVSPFPDLLTSITNSIGTAITFSYKPLTDGSIYTKLADAVYPIMDVRSPLYVASSVSSNNGIGGTLTTTNQYGGLKADHNGRGLLGFRWMEATSQETGIKVRNEFRQDFPFLGLPFQVKRTQSSSAVLSQVDNTYACKDFDGDPNTCTVAAGKRYFPFVSQSDELNRDLNGAFITKVRTITQFDSFGNVTQVVVTDLTEGGAATGYSKTTTNIFINDTANWLLGLLTRSTVTSTTP